MSTHDAINEVLYADPPLANFCVSYPRQPIQVDGVWLPAHEPVVIGIAACNNDPAIDGGDRIGNRAHLSWGVGEHACPAIPIARTAAQRAIDLFLDALTDIELAVPQHELRWRTGIFHRALVALPVTFRPVHAPLELVVPPLFVPIPRTDR